MAIDDRTFKKLLKRTNENELRRLYDCLKENKNCEVLFQKRSDNGNVAFYEVTAFSKSNEFNFDSMFVVDTTHAFNFNSSDFDTFKIYGFKKLIEFLKYNFDDNDFSFKFIDSLIF